MKKIAVLNLIVLVLTFVFPVVVNADNLNIPGGYQAAYHHLLEQRQNLMNDRATSIRNLSQCDSWLVQIDKALVSYTSTVNRERLMSSRSYIAALKDKLQRSLDYQQRQILNTDKDLAWLETEMKHFACMK